MTNLYSMFFYYYVILSIVGHRGQRAWPLLIGTEDSVRACICYVSLL